MRSACAGVVKMEHDIVTYDARRLRMPFFCQVSGASHTGKSHFVAKLILNRDYMFSDRAKKVIWCYSVYQPLYDEIKTLDPFIQFRQGLNFNPEREKIDRPDGKFEPVVMVVDDLGVEALKSEMFYDLAIKLCHHWNISVFYITQHLFSKVKNSKEVNDQCSYMAIFRSPRDESSVGVVGTQSFKRFRKAFLKAYELATEIPFECLFVDLTAACPRRLRLRSDIFHPHPIVFVIKGT